MTAEPALIEPADHFKRFDVTDGFVFTTLPGNPVRRSVAASAFKRASAAAGVEAKGWHDLRHHCASVLIASGVGVTGVAATLGHTPDECLKTYTHWWPGEGDRIRQAIESAWLNPGRAGAKLVPNQSII